MSFKDSREKFFSLYCRNIFSQTTRHSVLAKTKKFQVVISRMSEYGTKQKQAKWPNCTRVLHCYLLGQVSIAGVQERQTVPISPLYYNRLIIKNSQFSFRALTNSWSSSILSDTRVILRLGQVWGVQFSPFLFLVSG